MLGLQPYSFASLALRSAAYSFASLALRSAAYSFAPSLALSRSAAYSFASLALRSAASSSKSMQTSVWPPIAAKWSGVLRILSSRFTSAPHSTNRHTASTSLFAVATCNAVHPFASALFTFTPYRCKNSNRSYLGSGSWYNS